MTALRCTQKLLKAMKTTPFASLAPGTNRLGDWTIDLLHTHPKLMVAISEYDRLKSKVSDSFDPIIFADHFEAHVWRKVSIEIQRLMPALAHEVSSYHAEYSQHPHPAAHRPAFSIQA